MKLRNVIAAFALAVASVPAMADPCSPCSVVLNPTATTWFNSNPASGANPVITTGAGPSTLISWGTPFAPNTLQSSYSFTAFNPVNFSVIPPGISAILPIGEFIHNNYPITPPTLQSVSLSLTENVVVDSVNQGNFVFTFNFTHEETPNGGVPPGGPFTGTCPYGPANGTGINVNGCADRVTISQVASSQSFLVNGVQYTLQILGFAQNPAGGGNSCANPTTEFLTIENQDNHASLCAVVRATNTQIPEPGSLALVGLALLAAGFMRRKTNG